MAALDFGSLYTTYDSFYYPSAKVYLGGQDPTEDKKLQLFVSDFEIELTSDYKASIATFSISGLYDSPSGKFRTEEAKKYLLLGNPVKILLGYSQNVTEVFRGYIARVEFCYSESLGDSVFARITAMDVKGIMMANNCSKRLKANYYSDAVKEILDQAPYQNLTNNEVIQSITVSDTPDKPAGGGAGAGGPGGQEVDNRIEMVAESDYDFVVKAAKKFNYEFFSIGGNVAFRKAKANTQELAEIYPSGMVLNYDISYDITGLAGEVKVRTLDIGKANKIEVKKKNTSKFSLGGKAKPLISSQSIVYIDSTIETQADAENRANYLLEEMSYRLGSIRMTMVGLPELVPGRFITLKDFGDAVSNKYYITDVTHTYQNGGKFVTLLEGKAATL